MEFLTLTWEDFHTKVYDLSQKIEASGNKFDMIVAIARGGLTIAHVASDFLHLPITAFTISSYQDLKQHKNPEVRFKLGESLHKKKILLMDDVSDTGKTFVRAVSYLHELGAEDIKTAAVFLKPWATFTPDFYVAETSSWIIFPYDMRETVESLHKKYREEGITEKDIRAKLRELAIPEQYITRYSTGK